MQYVNIPLDYDFVETYCNKGDMMKVSDYIVDFLIKKKVSDVFGYPGGMVTHLMDSLGKKEQYIKTHITYHEQAAAFAACGYAQATDNIGVAFATSGPGATNLITGIGNAYFDSIPTIFITGQVNSFESKGQLRIRQKGFQETQIVPMVSEITKAAIYVEKPEDIPYILEKVYQIAMEDRKGPVLVDIPMNVFRAEIETDDKCFYSNEIVENNENIINEFEHCIKKELQTSKRPCVIIGNGVKIDHQIDNIRKMFKDCSVPVVSSMLAVDVIPETDGFEDTYYGFIGAYGNRSANFIVAKSDLLICLGTRLDVRQVGGKREQFAPNAKIIRIDVDEAELDNIIHENDSSFVLKLKEAIPALAKVLAESENEYKDWLEICKIIKEKVKGIDDKKPNKFIEKLSEYVPDEYSIVADVGQHMVWTAQSFRIKPNQKIYFSGGMGSMGYALPAAIGIYYATKKTVICLVGDGGIQMNIQELQFLVREKLPIKIVVLNNDALGMIRHFQEMYFESNYYYTVNQNGYSVPDFVKVAEAYGIQAKRVLDTEDMEELDLTKQYPQLIEVILDGDTYVFPKLEFGKPNQDQEPLLDRALYNYLMEL